MASFSGDKEQMAAHVQELLSLDRVRQRMMLENLSNYQSAEAAMNPWTGPAQALQCEGLGMTQGVSKAGGTYFEAQQAFAAAQSQQSKVDLASQTPVKVELPAGRDMRCKPDDTAAQLQQAAHVLQAALANWEACVLGAQGSPVAGRSMEPLAQLRAAAAANALTPEALGFQPAPGLHSQALPQAAARAAADVERAQKVAEYAKVLEKALQNLNTSLPRESAEKAQALLQGVAMDKTEAGKPDDKLKWLGELLKTQNQVSIDKMNKMIQESRQQAATTAMLAAAAGIQFPQAGGLAGLAGNQLAARPAAGSGSPNWQAMAAQHLPFGPVAAGCAGASPGSWWNRAAGETPAAQTEPPRKGGGPKKRSPLASGGASGGTSPDANHSSGETLRMHLRSLLNVDSNRVLIVRKINRLGFSSPTILKEHFSWYGTVENVLVAHSRVKSGGGQAGMVSRLRPSGLGFVVMSKNEEAELILAQGAEQQVMRTVIRVQKFERRMSEAAEAQEDEEDEQVAIKQEQDNFSAESRAMGA
mmetsp:Transcript_33808/g.78169  ORF Transcript_33808/g.78169 Transcript_33808/m.78169 type:complete len:530 (-) Transcript_33808:301-1890(-)